MSPLPGGTPRKDSIFSSITPAQPAPAPMPAPAPRPAVDAEAVNTLKLKIDALEKNIVAQLEKKLGDQAKAAIQAPPSPPAPPQASTQQEQLLRKIEDLERRLSDSTAVSASHLRNIEESKISARREIEDLLKAVREQQKYSELDRQMHDQLEKAWTRAEALEKKLMDFYASVLELEARRKEDSSSAADKAAASSERLAAALEALSSRIEHLERRGSESSLPALAEDIRRNQQEFMSKAMREGNALLAAQEEAGREMLANFRESATSLRDFFDNQFRRELTMLNERVAAENAALRREITAALEESRRLAREQGDAAAARTAEFGRLLESTRLKAESAEAALETSARRQALALEEFARRMDAELRAVNADFLAASRRDSEDRFSRFGAKYADALLAVTFIESFRAAVGGALDRLESHGGRMAAFLAHVSPGQLEKLLGVSGEMVRDQFEAMANASEGLKADIAALREIKRGIEEKVRGVFGAEK